MTPGHRLCGCGQGFGTQYCARLKSELYNERTRSQFPYYFVFQTLPFISPSMEDAPPRGRSSRNTSLKALFTYLRTVHFPWNPLMTDFLSSQSPWKTAIVSLPVLIMQGQMLSCAFHCFPLSGLPVGSCWSSSCHMVVSRQLRGTRLGITRSELKTWLLTLLAGCELCLLLNLHQQRG